MLHDLVLNVRVVPVLAVVFDFTIDLRVLRENALHQELLRQSERFNIHEGNVHEFGLGVVAQVVVTEERVYPELVRYFVSFLVKWLLKEMVADPHNASLYEVHLEHFLLLVIDDILIVVL